MVYIMVKLYLNRYQLTSVERPEAADTFLTERQRDVLLLRERGLTQSEIAEEFGTSAANVSMILSSAEENVEKARLTVELAKYIRTPQRIEVGDGDHIEEVVRRIYDMGDVQGVKVKHSKPELYSTVYDELSDGFDGERYSGGGTAEIALAESGEIEVFRERSEDG